MKISTVIVPQTARLDAHVTLTHLPEPIIRQLTALATFTNPEWTSRRKMGRSVTGVPQYIECWALNGHQLILPRGLRPRIRMEADVVVEDQRIVLPPVDFRWRGQLRPEQRQAVLKALQRADGVLVGPPGCGKTNMALAYVAARRQPTLLIVPTRELAYQTLDRARKLFELPEEAYGLIGDGTQTLGSHLTVGIVQTLIRRDLAELAGHFSSHSPQSIGSGSQPLLIAKMDSGR